MINIPRKGKKGNVVYCYRYEIRIYSDSKKESVIDGFCVTEGVDIASTLRVYKGCH